LVSWSEGTVELKGGGLDAATTYSYAVQCVNNKLKLVSLANPLNLKLTALTNGTFTATFKSPSTHQNVVCQGALLQAPGWGGGWFMDGKGGLIRITGSTLVP
jgi:hypothetical protein